MSCMAHMPLKGLILYYRNNRERIFVDWHLQETPLLISRIPYLTSVLRRISTKPNYRRILCKQLG